MIAGNSATNNKLGFKSFCTLCLLLLAYAGYLIFNNEERGKDEYNSFLNKFSAESDYTLYLNSSDARDGINPIKQGKVNEKLYACFLNAQTRNKGGTPDAKPFYLVIFSEGKQFVFNTYLLQSGEIYFFEYVQFQEYGEKPIRMLETSEKCYL